MNILFDASVLNREFTGVAKTLLYLYQSCREIDNDFCAYGFGCNTDEKRKFSRFGIELITDNDLASFSKKYKIQAIHYPFNNGAKKRINGIPQVLTIHDIIPLEENTFRNSTEKFKYIIKMCLSLYHSDKVITVSEYARRSIKKYSHDRIDPVVIKWGVTLPIVEKSEIAIKSFPYFLYVGGYDERKGIDKLVEAYMHMYSNGLTESKLIIAGKKKSLGEKTDSLIQKGINNGCIIQTGYVTDEEICSLYSGAICSVYLSKAEGFGLPLIESMQYECPIITTNLTSLPEVGGEAACYVNRNDQNSIINMMIRLETDKVFRNEKIVQGKKNLERFSWHDSAKVFLKLLDEVSRESTKGKNE